MRAVSLQQQMQHCVSTLKIAREEMSLTEYDDDDDGHDRKSKNDMHCRALRTVEIYSEITLMRIFS